MIGPLLRFVSPAQVLVFFFHWNFRHSRPTASDNTESSNPFRTFARKQRNPLGFQAGLRKCNIAAKAGSFSRQDLTGLGARVAGIGIEQLLAIDLVARDRLLAVR